MRTGLAAAIAVAALVGAVAAMTVGTAGSTHPRTVTGQAEKSSALATTATATGGQAATIIPDQGAHPSPAVGAPGTAAPTILPVQPTVEDVQRMLAGITAQILASASYTGSTQPLTKEQVEDQVRTQLKQLGINY